MIHQSSLRTTARVFSVWRLHIATHCNALQHTSTSSLRAIAGVFSAWRLRTATHCNALQHAATLFKLHTASLQATTVRVFSAWRLHTATHSNARQHTATLFTLYTECLRARAVHIFSAWKLHVNSVKASRFRDSCPPFIMDSYKPRINASCESNSCTPLMISEDFQREAHANAGETLCSSERNCLKCDRKKDTHIDRKKDTHTGDHLRSDSLQLVILCVEFWGLWFRIWGLGFLV